MENHFLLKTLLREMSSAHPRLDTAGWNSFIIGTAQKLPEVWTGGSCPCHAPATRWSQQLEWEREMRWQILGHVSLGFGGKPVWPLCFGEPAGNGLK